MKISLQDRTLDLATMCCELCNTGFTPSQVALQLFELAYHHQVLITTTEIRILVAEAFI